MLMALTADAGLSQLGKVVCRLASAKRFGGASGSG
jgi:hypothetical protein